MSLVHFHLASAKYTDTGTFKGVDPRERHLKLCLSKVKNHSFHALESNSLNPRKKKKERKQKQDYVVIYNPNESTSRTAVIQRFTRSFRIPNASCSR